MMRKKLNGYMTVFSSLCFALIVSLITVCIDGARLQGARVLLAGGKVDIMKTDDTWMMSLDNLMNKDIKNNTKQSDSGYTYKQYLQFMLYLKNEETVIVRMMDLIEEKMHKLGYTGFAMKNCIYSLDTTSSYDIKNGSRNIKVIAHKNY